MSRTLLNQTWHAGAERLEPREVEAQAEALAAKDVILPLIDALPQLVAILNAQRQIVLANEEMARQLAGGNRRRLRGLRTGEALHCTESLKQPGGCGTGEACRYCGAVNAVLSARRSVTDMQDCQISQEDGGTLDLRVKASPLGFEPGGYTLVSLLDIAAEKRREVLERTFFHDILNSAAGIAGVADILVESRDLEEVGEFAFILQHSSRELLAEIRAQRELLAAERWELDPHRERFDSRELLQELAQLYQLHPVAEQRRLFVDEDAVGVPVRTAKALLFRVVGNMVKNALETVPEGGRVRIGCEADGDEVGFWVHNDGAIPREIQLQLFRRSFSTKGAGRGIGTYSMKLLSERYLGGRVDFRSDTDSGTVFRVRIPREWT